jgi:Family of unknown function (DUF6325)
LVFVRKDADGAVAYFEYDDLEELKSFAEIDGETDGLLGDTDIAEMSAQVAPGSSALFIVWEDTWAGELGRAVRKAGGALVAGGRIPYQVAEAALASASPPAATESTS